jgi:arginyl-tRNA synthetase
MAVKGKKAPIDKIPKLLQADFSTGLKAQVLAEVKKAVKALGFDDSLVSLDHPVNPEHGDYTTNIALKLFSKEKAKFESALDLAKEIQAKMAGPKSSAPKDSSLIIEKIETASPGFLNIRLKNEALISQLREVIRVKEKYGNSDFLKDKRILLEHTSPDPIKTIHIGHLRNNFLGMAMSRIFQALGARVTLDCINNDRGTHVSRAIFGYLAFGNKKLNLDQEKLLKFKLDDEEIKRVLAGVDWRKLIDDWLTAPGEWYRPEDLNLKSDHLNLVFYSLGNRAEKLVEDVKQQVRTILGEWEEEKPKVRALWRQIIDWSLSGYAATYQQIGSHHDRVWHESDLYQGGKNLIDQGLERGVFKKSQGAIVTYLAAYDLPDTVVIKSDGTALYHTFDIFFTQQKIQNFPSDLYIWDIGNDQLLYLRQLFAICEQLGIGRREDYYHLNYGYVFLKGGEKMSSRAGTVISADELLDLLEKEAYQLMAATVKPGDFSPEEISRVAKGVGLAAIKYGLLKTNRSNDIHFDPKTSVNLSGNAGPYLQYTYTRTQSVLKKAVDQKLIFSVSEYDLFQGKLAGIGRRLAPVGFGQTPFPVRPGGPLAKSPGMPRRNPGPDKISGSRPSVRAKAGIGQPASKSFSDFSQPFPGGIKPPPPPKLDLKFNQEEKALLGILYRYPEIILEAGQRLEPALVCNFLFDLAQKFNLFYDRHSILGAVKPAPSPAKETVKEPKSDQFGQPGFRGSSEGKELLYFRLALSAATGQVLKNGLILLGIEPLEKM